ncbi:hypothetical protein [Neorhizobium sp. NCHU2750]|uniref:hypothetical protein n=1 Tax=Neorhizobium sp. NCHU2750 TaxID=1825976 RepID=UPI000E71B7F8|nr:transcription factor [Neorhizobium sp. NCHU2750]
MPDDQSRLQAVTPGGGPEETPMETAGRLREKYGIELTDKIRTPLPREANDALWDDRDESR